MCVQKWRERWAIEPQDNRFEGDGMEQQTNDVTYKK
jgi:hypothetical protein